MSRKSVLIIHRYFWPENISETPYLLKTIAEMHIARGDKVSIATGISEDFTPRWAEAFGDAVNIEHFVAPSDRGQPVWRKLVALLKLMRVAIGQILKAEPDLIYTISYPPGFSAFVILSARIFRGSAKTVYYVQDLLTYRIGNPLLRRIYTAVSGWMLRNADRTITLSPAMRRQLATYDPSGKADISVIANCFAWDGDMGPSGGVRRDVIYAGAHGKSQNLLHFLRVVAAIAPGERPEVEFFGDGDEKASLMQAVEQLGIAASITFSDPVPREQIIEEMATSRFGLVGAVPGLMNYAFPSKIANYTCAGTPALIMCESGGEMADWLAEKRLGLAIDPVDVESAAAALTQALAEARGQPAERGLEISRSAVNFFGVEGYQRQLAAVVDGLDDGG